MNFLLSAVRKNDITSNLFGLASILGLIWSGFSLGLIAFQSLFIEFVGITWIPYAYIFFALSSVITANLYIYLLNFFDNRSILFYISLISAGLCLFSRFLVQEDSNSNVSIVLFFANLIVIITSTTTILLSAIWDLIGRILPPIKHRKYMFVFSITPAIASLISGLLLNLIAISTSALNVLFLLSAIYLLCATITFFKYIKSFNLIKASSKVRNYDIFTMHIDVLSIFKNKLFSLLLIIALLSFLTTNLNIYQFMYVASENFDNKYDLMWFFANFQIVSFTIITIYLIFFGKKIVNMLGIFSSMITLPIILIVGSSILLFYSNYWSVITLRLFIFVNVYAIFNGAQSFSYSIIDPVDRNKVMAIAEIMKNIGTALAGVLILITEHNNTLITLTLLIVSLLFFFILAYGKTIYKQTLVHNLLNKKQLFNTLESIEDAHDSDINDALIKLLIDESSHNLEEKIKIVATIRHLNNPKFLGILSAMLNHPEPLVRKSLLGVIATLFEKVSSNPFVRYHFFQKITEIFNKDPSPIVRAEAAAFLINHADHEKLFYFFELILNSKQEEIVRNGIRAFRYVGAFSDLLEINNLKSSNPTLKAESAISLSKYSFYQAMADQAILELFNSEKDQDIIAGLKALSQLEITPQFLPIIDSHLNSPHQEIKAYAHYAHVLHSFRQVNYPQSVFDELVHNFSSIFGSHEEKWIEFIDALFEINNLHFIDQVYDSLLTFSISEEALSGSLKKVASLMDVKTIHSEMHSV